MNRAPRVALYARVSTFDQDPELQLRELRELARQRGWGPVAEYIDHGVSGTRFKRPGLDRLLADAQAGRLDVVAVWRLDRLGRSSLDLVRTVLQLERWRVQFVSLRDPGMDTTTSMGRLIFQILAAFAEFEKNLNSERTRAGLARARERGVRLGRPLAQVTPEAAAEAVRQHGTIEAAARAFGVSRATLRARLAQVAKKVPAEAVENDG